MSWIVRNNLTNIIHIQWLIRWLNAYYGTTDVISIIQEVYDWHWIFQGLIWLFTCLKFYILNGYYMIKFKLEWTFILVLLIFKHYHISPPFISDIKIGPSMMINAIGLVLQGHTHLEPIWGIYNWTDKEILCMSLNYQIEHLHFKICFTFWSVLFFDLSLESEATAAREWLPSNCM